ncbi:phosphatidate cytidylyltransferase [Ancylobacter sp. A5.8]|uniref:phosphatidate cytidylyltransferase n=1 Tax=Ancylobacter gelatini TaxID=2919920 RepID=UPI001F4F01A8|nr:phosphatidate cytidylyltransferase [Ancylobacter gelatini]MCJ8143120.1 phosphatidate cytidylyltransferase [Ancylobacter gelatini]
MAIGPDLLPRVASAMLLAPVVLFAAFIGGWPFAVMLAIAAVLVLWEWLAMTAARPGRVLLALGGGALLAALASLYSGGTLPLAAAIALIGAAALALVARGGGPARLWALGGMVYAAGVMFPAQLLRADDTLGLISLGWLLAVVWTTDIAAYFCGRLIGGPKLWPRVSPNKTWSGALGGAILATLAGVLVLRAAGIESFLSAAPVAFVVSVASQGGDLFESSMKRRFGVKDSSHLIPGHGGLMDRLDGFIVGAALALAIGLLHAPDAPARGLLIW